MPDPLDEVLRQAQDLGFFGPGPVAEQRRHAEELCDLALSGLDAAGVEFVDLGSGGGLPGLVLAARVRDAGGSGALLESQQRRAEFLVGAVERLGLGDHLDVVNARAEDAARDPVYRERSTLVIARSFASPAVTAECAVGLLAPGARLVVSEPPDPDPSRWPTAQLATLGLSPAQVVGAGATHAALLHRQGLLDPKWPRKRGIPEKRPLW